MEQYRNLSGAMETRNHSKNGTCLKNQMNSGNFATKLMLLCLMLFISVGVWGQTSAEIEKVWIDFDVYESNQKGMRIHLKFTVDGMLNKQGTCNAWFYMSDGTALKDYNNSYKTTAGTVSTWENYKPGYASAVYNDFKLFIPYSELHLAAGSHSLKFHIGIFDNSGKQIAISEYQNFSITQPAQTTITTTTTTYPTTTYPTTTYPTTTFEKTWHNCSCCNGTGNCRNYRCSGGKQQCGVCNGSGKHYNSYTKTYERCSSPLCRGGYSTCPTCNGQGRCNCCNGTRGSYY